MSEAGERFETFDCLKIKRVIKLLSCKYSETHSQLVVAQFQHFKICERWKILNDRNLIRTQEQLFNVNESVKVLYLLQAVEADVELPVE